MKAGIKDSYEKTFAYFAANNHKIARHKLTIPNSAIARQHVDNGVML
jgi:hypothetical protein